MQASSTAPRLVGRGEHATRSAAERLDNRAGKVEEPPQRRAFASEPQASRTGARGPRRSPGEGNRPAPGMNLLDDPPNTTHGNSATAAAQHHLCSCLALAVVSRRRPRRDDDSVRDCGSNPRARPPLTARRAHLGSDDASSAPSPPGVSAPGNSGRPRSARARKKSPFSSSTTPRASPLLRAEEPRRVPGRASSARRRARRLRRSRSTSSIPPHRPCVAVPPMPITSSRPAGAPRAAHRGRCSTHASRAPALIEWITWRPHTTPWFVRRTRAKSAPERVRARSRPLVGRARRSLPSPVGERN